MKAKTMRITVGCLLVLAYFNTGASGSGCDESQIGGSANVAPNGSTPSQSNPSGDPSQNPSGWPAGSTSNDPNSGSTTTSGTAGTQEFGDTCDAQNACESGLVCTGGTCVSDGNLRFTLVWEASTDLDIYVKTPSGETIYYRNRYSEDGGVYERDACINTGCDTHEGAFVETIVWQSAVPTSGTYEFWAENYNGDAPANFTFDVRADGVREQYQGSVGGQRGAKSNSFALTVGNPNGQTSSGGSGGTSSSGEVWDGDEHDGSGLCGHRWHLPTSVRNAGEHQHVDRDGAGACTGGPTDGAVEFGDRIRSRFGHLMNLSIPGEGIQIYNCRSVRGGSNTSLHGVGRAIDVYIPADSSEYNNADNAKGDIIANWLVENAEHIGVQYIIWDRTQWKGYASGRKDSCYGGAHDHQDHIHVELNHDGANMRTPYF